MMADYLLEFWLFLFYVSKFINNRIALGNPVMIVCSNDGTFGIQLIILNRIFCFSFYKREALNSILSN